MRLITQRRLLEFIENYPDAKISLERWYRIVKHVNFDSFAELRKVFPSADKVGKLTVFNIGGNKYRLIAAIHYNRHIIYIRHVLTHKQYDKGMWKDK